MKKWGLILLSFLCLASQAENLYVYKKGDNQLFLTNLQDNQGENLFGVKSTYYTVPTSQGISTIQIDSSGKINPQKTSKKIKSDILTDGLLLMHSQAKIEALESHNKKWSRYQKWHYLRKNSDFDEDIKMTLLLSNDGHAGLFLAYNDSDKNQENPNFGIFLSNEFGEDTNKVLCRINCMVDINIDGAKYQNMEIVRTNDHLLFFKYPSLMLEQFKGGKAIKIRLSSIDDDYLIYEFEPETILDLKTLKSL